MLMNTLAALRRKVRLLSVAYGLGVVLALAVALVLCTTLLDYLLNLPAIPRLIVILAALGALAYALFNWIYRPLASRLTISDVAGRLEHAFPQFDDRLRSTVDFLSHDVPGSDVMKDRVVAETASLASQVDLAKAVDARPAWYSLTGGALSVVLIVLLATVLISPQYVQIALSRLFSPFDGQPWPKRVQIEVASQTPDRLPVGQRLDLMMRLVRGDKASMKAVVLYQYDDGPIEQELMTRQPDGSYRSSLDTRIDPNIAAGKLKIWIKAGDDRVDLSPITVVPRLAIKSVQAEINPPPYVPDAAATTVNLSAAPAVVASGSAVTLKVAFNKPLSDPSSVTIVPVSEEMHPPQLAWASDGTAAVAGQWTARDSIRFHIRATDTDNFANNALEEFEIVVRPDQTPSVQIENPRRNEERTPVAVIPLQGLAEDDYGIQWLKLVVERISDRKRWDIPLVESGAATGGATWTRAEAAGERQRFRTSFAWDLAQLADANLKPGDVLEYHLLVKDNFSLDGQSHPEVASAKLRIAIISQEDLTGRVVDDLRQIKNLITDLKGAQGRIEQETAGLQNDTKAKPELDPADRAAAERITTEQATAAAQAKMVASKVENIQQRLDENKSPANDLKDVARDVKNDMNQTAENPMKDATLELTKASQPKSDPAGRNAALDQARQSQDQAAKDLQRALDRMSNIGSLEQTIANVKKLLEEQQEVGKETRDIGKENLGKRPEEMKPQDRERLEKNADAQQKLADKTQKAMDDMGKLADQMKKSDPTSSEAMEKAASTGKQQQVTPSQRKASQQAKQNQQAQAQAAQKQAELGLELMLNELREAERAKLAALAKKLEELQNQIANLIRRQAGHNLDNLALQGPDRIANLNQEVLSDLMTRAQRDKSALPPVPKLDQLSPAQEQTERNTRDIAKSAEALPNGGEPAAHLSRAAGKMERAIISIREQKLPEAYDPAQIEALAALDAARKIVDEQKSKVDEQIADKDKEAVRQKYVRIKADQERLNAETTRIENARQPDGTLARADAVRLGQLPSEQGKLVDDTAKISEDLAAVGSVVYIWANKDIVQSMSDVKSDLAKPTTGAPTQAEQTRIVEQLDAMIRNLATKPKESKFAQDGGGGGGQSNPGPQLPTEAELRLLQDLQRAVNKSTKTIDAQPEKDKPKLLALGNRQGELRNLLDQTLQNASRGEMKLGPEPDNRDQLPEEAKGEAVEDQELDRDLLEGVPDDKKNETKADLIGDRMARSRQRLALNNDPGRITQVIQDRIIEDFDYLIDQARQQQAQSRNPQQGSKGQRKPAPKPGENMAQAQNQGDKPGQSKPQKGGTSPAGDSKAPGASAVNADLSRDIRESGAEWGAITPRIRDAVIEGASDRAVEEYRKMIEEYYKSVATKANER